jgi:hypothetical protein
VNAAAIWSQFFFSNTIHRVECYCVTENIGRAKITSLFEIFVEYLTNICRNKLQLQCVGFAALG